MGRKILKYEGDRIKDFEHIIYEREEMIYIVRIVLVFLFIFLVGFMIYKYAMGQVDSIEQDMKKMYKNRAKFKEG
jgi:uncharacterized protein YpmB